jgi:lysophospholipase L1-like esterase
MNLSSLQILRERAKSEQPILWNFLGDSITHGALHTWGWRDYVELFEERVRWQLRRADDVVIKTAFSGYTVPYTQAKLEQRCIRFQPDIVGIMLGVNDADMGMDNLPAFEEGYLTLIRRIREETPALVFIQTPNRLDGPNSAMRGQCIEAYAEAVRRVARRADVPCRDHYAVWQAFEAHQKYESYYLRNFRVNERIDAADFLPLPDMRCFLSPDWFYHKDTAVMKHPLCAGVRTGFMDWDYYYNCIPVDAIVTDAQADCAAAFFYVGGPITDTPYAEFLGGHVLSSFTYGKGSFALTAFPLLQNTGSSPAGDRILLNLLK